VEAAPDLTPLILTSRKVNDAQPHYVLRLVQRALGVGEVGKSLAGCRVACLGLSYKPDVDDLRESPAIEVAHLLTEAGAEVKAYEPFKKDAQIEGILSLPSLEEAIQGADAVVLLAAHQVFKELNPEQLKSLLRKAVLVDTVGAINSTQWQAAGFQVYRLGDTKSKPGG
jgi:UDP-N-acetyl-D-mannosaminuronic acid dehydrogenase